MPWGVAAAVAGAATSAALAPSPSGGGGSSGQSYYVPTGLGSADQSWQQLLAQQQQTQAGVQGTVPYYLQSLMNANAAQGQYAPAYQNAASAAGQQYSNLAGTFGQQAGMDFATQQQLLGAGQNVYQTALDPQNALYNRTVQQLQDQTGATNSMYGLGSSAAGAGVANQALSNFNIDWQNQQLQRQLSGLQGYGQAATTAGQYGQAGQNAAAAVPGYTVQSGQLPYQTAQNIAEYPGQAAQQYASQVNSGPLSSAQSINSQIIPYLNYGQGAQQVPYQNAQQGAGAAGALASQGIQGLGSNPQIQSTLGNLFGGGPTGSFSGGNFSGAFNSSPYYSGGGNSYGFTMG